MTNNKNIVIAGAGFGGITAAINLAKYMTLLPGWKLILVDRHDYQLYTPALYEIASVPNEYLPLTTLKSSIALPIKNIIRSKPIEFIQDEILGFDTRQKKLELKKTGLLSYEYIVLALGSETNYFNIPGLKENSLPLKTFRHAVELRNSLETVIREKNELEILVGGGGATGVELISEFVNFVCTLEEEILNSIRCKTNFTLLEASGDILSGFADPVREKAKKRLRSLGVKISTGNEITSVAPGIVTFRSGQKRNYDLLVWTGGVKGPAILAGLDVKLSSKGTLEVDEYLRVKGLDGSIFAVGDIADFTDKRSGKPLGWNVPVAEGEGGCAARNVLRSIRGEKLCEFFPWKKYPFILAVGEKYAIADLVFLRFSGILGWWAKQLVEFRYLFSIFSFWRACRTAFRELMVTVSND